MNISFQRLIYIFSSLLLCNCSYKIRQELFTLSLSSFKDFIRAGYKLACLVWFIFSPFVLILLFFVSFISCSKTMPFNDQRNAAASTLSYLGDKHGFVENAQLNKLLFRVLSRLSSSANNLSFKNPNLCPDNNLRNMPCPPWNLYILKSKQPNAFSLGAGVIVVSTALLLEVKNEAALASVISHEMAHQLLLHSADALSDVQTGSIQPTAVFSLPKEISADNLSIQILLGAAYNPSYALSALSIGFRSKQDLVSANIPPEWLGLRAANMENQLKAFESFDLSIENTREFNRVIRESYHELAN